MPTSCDPESCQECRELIAAGEDYCHECGNPYIIHESSAEGYWCPKCHCSDMDE